MRAVVQRVKTASVAINGENQGAINQGLVILLGIESEDGDEDVNWLCKKIAKMRIFPDEHKPMNQALLAVDGEALVVSQFTLHASTKKGNRPSFMKAAKPAIAAPLYEQFVKTFERHIGKPVATGKFGADMQVSLCNDGPVTIIIDSKNRT